MSSSRYPFHDSQSQTSSQAHDAQSTRSDVLPIAIVGMACRFPGDAANVKGLWDMCCEGRSAWSEIPQSRMNAEAFFHPDPSKTGSFNNRGAHFVKEDLGLFDAPFFNISPYEAKAMDPQQRILLETTYEALENSGTPLNSIRGQNVGVYVGASISDYSELFARDPEFNLTYRITGTAPNILSNRLSYMFDLRGPSFTVDTACSSSLAAFHLACQSLKTGEIRQAIVGGSYLVFSPAPMIGMSKLRLYSESGRSYTYDHRGTGYGRGEGVATIILKPLQDAIDAGDTIRAVIRNTGMNQDGKTNGITLPSKDAQESLIRSVYAAAGLDPLNTSYVEAHGTGTKVGDPIEAEAISRAMTTGRCSPLIIGSVKTNIGHLEAASGLASIIKTVRILETGLIPPNINFEMPNEDIPLTDWQIKIPTELTAWPATGLKRASISNFGFGGTNVHIILEEFRDSIKTEQNAPPIHDDRFRLMNGHVFTNGTHQGTLSNNTDHETGGSRAEQISPETEPDSFHPHRMLFILTAADKDCAKRQSQDLSLYLQPDLSQDVGFMADLAFTLAERRSMHDWRLAVSASSVQELKTALENGDVHLNRVSVMPRLGFIFTGQGAQWPAMGQELMVYPVFAAALREADDCIRSLGAGWSLLDEITRSKQESNIHYAHISQPATTAIQIAIVLLLRAWNIKPSAVLGHSSGEIAAAFSAGILDLGTCMRIAYHRGSLALKLKQGFPNLAGGMLAIGASLSEAQRLVDTVKDAKVVIACINGPSLVTISGDREGIVQLQHLAESEGYFARSLHVDVAYHSHHMEYVAETYREDLGDIVPMNPSGQETAFYSSLGGRQMNGKALEPSYWVANLTNPVQFTQALGDLCAHEKDARVDTLLEIGPHSALQAPIQDLLKANTEWAGKFRYFSCLRREEDARLTLLSAIADLASRGYPVAVSHVNLNKSRKVLVDLPPYPWMHKRRHWYESRVSVNHRFRRFARNDLLGVLVDDVNDLEPRWRNKLLLSELPWLRDHRVQSTTVFPFAGYVSIAIQAAYQQAIMEGRTVKSSSKYSLREVTVQRSLVLSETSEVELSTTFKRQKEGSRGGPSKWSEFTIYSWSESAGWSEHCRGLVTIIDDDGQPNAVDGKAALEAKVSKVQYAIAEMQAVCKAEVDCDLYYKRAAELGYQFGPKFQGLRAGLVGPDQCIAKISIPDTAATMPRNFESGLIIHPTTLDSCIQSAGLAFGGADFQLLTLYVPTFLKSMSVSHGVSHDPGHKLNVYNTTRVSQSGKEVGASYVVTDAEDQGEQPVIEIDGLISSALHDSNDRSPNGSKRGLCYSMQYATCLDLLTLTQYPTVFSFALEELQVKKRGREQTRMAERAAFYFAQTALTQLSTSDTETLGGHLRKLYNFLSAKLVQGIESSIPYQKPEWIHTSDIDKADILQAVESSSDYGKLVCAMGKNLLAILRGEVEPLSIMLKDGLLERFYQSDILLDQAYTQCARWIKVFGHQKPQMRIIEIGAGTGSATVHILNALARDNLATPSFAALDYTDVSPGFFERAKERFERWGGLINYRRLDIANDPVEQGFEPGSYDLVIAAEVLHATAHMDSTMRNVRTLVKPGGKVVIIEPTLLTMFHNIIFGTLPGWWVGEEAERSNGPTLTENQWDILLRQTGFSGLDGYLPDNIDDPQEPAIGGVIFSTATPEDSQQYAKASLLLTDQSQSLEIERLEKSMVDLTGEYPDVHHFEHFGTGIIDGKTWIVLAFETFSLLQLSGARFTTLQNILLRGQAILWVTRGARGSSPEASMIEGLARVIRSENAGVKLVTLDLSDSPALSDVDTASTISRVYAHVFGSNTAYNLEDLEFIEDKGIIHVRRVIEHLDKDRYIMSETQQPVPEPQPFVQMGRNLRLKIGTPGLLDSIYFEDDPTMKQPVADDEVELEIKATGMNFKDVMIGLGQIPFSDIGLECSGVVTAAGRSVQSLTVGDRVCGLTRGGYSNSARVPQTMVTRIPDNLSFTAAASIPIIFCTAYYSLIDIARLEPGESVLIHAAAGGVGQAAIMIAQHIGGVEIYATVGSPEKKNHLIENYDIPEDHIFSSRDLTFVSGLRDRTKGRGVDVILNSLAGEALSLSWRECLAPLGRFIEIGKRDLAVNNNLQMETFLKSVIFAGVDLGEFASAKAKAFHKMLSHVLELHQVGALVPVSPLVTYSMSELQSAMRLLQAGKHMGKVVITARGGDIVQVMPTIDQRDVARSDATYLITGGTGGLGRSITRWLPSQGAKKIVLASRSGISQASTRELVDELKEHGVEIVVYTCDIGEASEVEKMIHYVQATMPPIRGVIHGAMVIQDVLFEKANIDDWNAVVKARVQGAWNLHNSLLGNELDFFVLLASVAGIVGSRGQAAYAASNTFMDAFAEYRSQQGLPASVIDIGVVVGVGYVAEHQDREAQIRATAHDLINEKELLALVKAAINFDSKDAYTRQTITGCKLLPDQSLPWWAADPKFAHIVRGIHNNTESVAKKDTRVSIRESLKQASSLAQIQHIVEEALVGKIVSVSMTPEEDVDLDKPLAAYGMDSLVAVEIRNWITNEMAANIPALEFIASSSLAGLAKVIISKSTFVDLGAVSASATE